MDQIQRASGQGTAGLVLAAGLMVLLLFIGVYDLAVIFWRLPMRTVSDHIYSWSTDLPLLPLLCGLVLGHLFFPRHL